MAIQFRSTTFLTAAQTTTITINAPAGIVAGDLILLHLRTTNSVAPTSVPSDFVLIPGSEINNTNSIRIYSKVAGSSEPPSYSFTLPTGETARAGAMALYADNGSALNVDASANQSGVGTTYVAPSVTTTVPNILLTIFMSLNNLSAATAGSGLTKRYDTVSSTNSIFGATEAIPAAGATGTRSVTGVSTTYRVVTIAWKEDAAPTAPAISGTAAIPLADVTLTAQGTALIAGASAITLEGVTLNAAGTLPPSTPDALVATGQTASSIELTWTHDGIGTEGFSIERSNNGVSEWAEIATVDDLIREYTDSGLPESTERFYRIRAFRA